MYPNLAWPSRLRRGQAGWQGTSTCNVKSYPSSSTDTFRRSDLVHVYFFVIGARGCETCAQSAQVHKPYVTPSYVLYHWIL